MSQQHNVPALRFPEFSGEWEEKRLGDMGDFRGGGTPDTRSKKYWTGNIPWVSSSDIYDDTIHQISISRFINTDAIKESATKIIPKNSILLVSRVGVGKFAVTSQELCTSQDFSNFTPANDDVVFIAYWLYSNKNKLLSLCQGTSIKGFTVGDLRLLKVDIPQPEEQQKIASFLSSVDKKIEQLRKKKQLLGQYKKGMMQKLFAQEIRFKDDNGNDYPDWEEKKLEDCSIKIQDGTHFSPPLCNSEKYLYLTSKNVKNGYLDFSDVNYISEAEHNKIYKRCDVSFGDVLLTKDGTIGQVCVNTLKEDFSLLSSVAFIRADNKTNNFFLYHMISSEKGQKEINKAIAGQALKRITLTKIRNFKYTFPQLPEQTKIANFLSAIDDKINLIEAELTHAQTFKKGLLQQMFV